MEDQQAQNEYLHTVVHDLKSPINAVRGCLELVQHTGPLNERQEHFVNRAVAGLQRMEHLVSRILDLSWIDADAELNLAEANLFQLASETVDALRDMANTAAITLRVESDDEARQTVVDAYRMAQVIDNLVSNAIKYNNEGGEVVVTITYDPDFVKVSVQDNGMGISEEDQAHVFDRFFRAHEGVRKKIEGSGLGLAITRGIVEKHNGRIWVESQPEVGTTFHFTLPLLVNTGEGNDGQDEIAQNLGEGPEGRINRRADLASEEQDVVNDNLQENRELSQIDSTSDEI